MTKPFFEIPSYHDYISPKLALKLFAEARPVDGVAGLLEVGTGGGLETPESLGFLVALYDDVKTELAKVLQQRIDDRKFIDERVKASFEIDPNVILGLQDGKGRIVIGPKFDGYHRRGGRPIAALPDFLKGPHVTLFGPPDSAKLAINAMNAFHRKTANEPAVVEKLLGAVSPMWGADDEDSKTPLRTDLVDAAVNLTACFDGTLALTEGSKKYSLADDHLALPIKRFPGLALPSTFLFYRKNPIPLHLYDFALHLHRNWRNPRALVFYVPKLENEEEAAYIHSMIQSAESLIKQKHPSYTEGTVRLMIVLENPRAILRAHEIMDALYPYFAGASLGWHDYLASTARIFKEDSGYRIPVKADPGIVIKYIKASHHLLAETVGSRGGVCVGGMYGILPTVGDTLSLQITLKGFIKDVVTQLKRKLNGFWVAHPDFVRLGLALVEAWKLREHGDAKPLHELVTALLDEKFHKETLGFIDVPDIEGLDQNDSSYVRALLVADIKESDFIANNHPEEIRYNVFQMLQYLADWLSGNGCVALPTTIDGIQVRVMDDLATAERSRWEVWHELHHGRFAVEDFLRIAHEEMNFIRRDNSHTPENTSGKIVQVKWDERTAKWYPVAYKLMLQLMTSPNPPEFATELLMPFTIESVRTSADPWSAICAVDKEKFQLERFVADYDHYFEICGSQRFASTMANNAVQDLGTAEKTVMSFTLSEIKEASLFHGNIGDSKKVLDQRAATEQSLVLKEDQSIKDELAQFGNAYLKKFGFKFLISAQGKTATEIRTELKRRMDLSQASEEQHAREALWEISRKRIVSATDDLRNASAKIESLRLKHGIQSASIAVTNHGLTQPLAYGSCTNDDQFEIASLSKTVAAAFALEYFSKKNISLSTSVNQLFAQTSSVFRIGSAGESSWGDEVQLSHLMNHTALNMHYVNGFPSTAKVPPVSELINGKHGYERVLLQEKPGVRFQYSGGGFLVLEHLIEALEGRSIQELTRPFLDSMKLKTLTFDPANTSCSRQLDFPAFAAGAFSSAADLAKFLQHLTTAFHSLDGSGGISHDTAVQMLFGIDKGARDFMGCRIGLGVFVAEAGRNRLMIHQGANEGFRSLFVHCYDGPDRGKGMVLFCVGDNNAVPFIAEAAQELFRCLEIEGVDLDRVKQDFKTAGMKQEQIVNLGYKRLLFDAFLPDLPEEIAAKGPLDPLGDLNLAVHSKIISVSNQRFARAENLISKYLPVFDPELFGRQGKIMDSWESARHNHDSCDWITLELKQPSKIKYVSFSTKYHDGNHAEFVRLEGRSADGTWIEIVPKTAFHGHSLMQLEVGPHDVPFSQVRLEMYPDGGISRLGLFDQLPDNLARAFSTEAKCVRFSETIPKTSKPLTIPFKVGAQSNRVVRASNEHYGPAAQVISPYPPIHMFDGLESARSRKPDHHEEVVIALGKQIEIDRVELDFKFFVNNNPSFVSIHGFNGSQWVELVGKSSVKAFAGNQKRFSIQNSESFEQVMLRVYPDGGVHRIKVFQQGSVDATTYQ